MPKDIIYFFLSFFRYRCYAYAASEDGFKVAKSGDASCHGLFSLFGGASTLQLRKGRPKTSLRVTFPNFPLSPFLNAQLI